MTVEPRILLLKTLVAAVGHRSGGSHSALVVGPSPCARWEATVSAGGWVRARCGGADSTGWPASW